MSLQNVIHGEVLNVFVSLLMTFLIVHCVSSATTFVTKWYNRVNKDIDNLTDFVLELADDVKNKKSESEKDIEFVRSGPWLFLYSQILGTNH